MVDNLASQLISANTLRGTQVYNHNGKNIGSIKDSVLDLKFGKIAYLVLSFGGFMGLGKDLFAIPWEAFSTDAQKENLVLNVPKKVLEKAEGFDDDDWPDASDLKFLESTYNYYEVKPYWT